MLSHALFNALKSLRQELPATGTEQDAKRVARPVVAVLHAGLRTSLREVQKATRIVHPGDDLKISDDVLRDVLRDENDHQHCQEMHKQNL